MKNLSRKGISLIVLVITIIVMIILATAIILSLNSSNIVEKAKEAKTASDMANAKNVVILAKGEWELMTTAERTTNGGTFNVYAESKLQEAGYAISGNNSVNVSSNGVVSTRYVDEDGREAIIPEGFTVSTKAGEQTITGGLVIIDDKGNEFVWIPVDDFENNFKRTTTYNGTITAPSSDYTEPCGLTDEGITLSLTNDLTGEWAEYTAMRASVQENGGFYIARYEAGKEGTNTLVSKKGATVWNNIVWGESMTELGTEGAVYYSRQMHKGSTSVVSTLCYGVQWDAALQFIASNTEHADYPLDSTGKGYYAYDAEGNEINPAEVQVTGSNEAYATNNIYDMAGNVFEWTIEADNTGGRVFRGGVYDAGGTDLPASSRYSFSTDYANAYSGFRPTLYIK